MYGEWMDVSRIDIQPSAGMLDKEVAGLIPGRTKLGNDFFLKCNLGYTPE